MLSASSGVAGRVSGDIFRVAHVTPTSDFCNRTNTHLIWHDSTSVVYRTYTRYPIPTELTQVVALPMRDAMACARVCTVPRLSFRWMA